MKKRCRKKGVSLIELLVAMTAVAILSLTVGAILVLPARTIKGNNEIAQLKNEVGVAMIAITSDVRESGYEDIVVNSSNYGDNTLTLPANDVRNSTIQYRLEGALLNRYVNGSGPTTLISEGVSAFRSWPTNNEVTGVQGMGLHLEMTTAGGVPLQHDSFIHTRN